MKKLKFFSLALAALTLGACSSDDVVVNDQPGTVPAGEPGYVSLAINLPTQPSTRATEDNSATLDDGDALEYNVNNAMLVLFTGTSEANATFYGAYNLTGGSSVDDVDDDHVTTTYTYTSAITKPAVSSSTKIYSLVVLNNSGLLKQSDGTWSLKGTNLTSTTTFTNFNRALTLDDQSSTSDDDKMLGSIANRTGNGNFLMTNAPLYTAAGGINNPTSGTGGTLQTLVEIDPNRIYDNETQARNNPAANIYVERAVAKVTLSKGSSITTSLPAGITAEIQGWMLDITNKHTYLVRNALDRNWWGYANEKVNIYRFVGNTALEDNGLYRTYWGEDPNYDGTGHSNTTYLDNNGDVVSTQNEFNLLAGTAPASDSYSTDFGYDNPLYCLENTFNTANMRKDQTTRVIVAVKLGVTGADSDGNFFHHQW